ncbi:MAG: HAD family hydrolase [Actinobacteria bacterium]|nr:HAD family hydrolase [Actinomycetota bacterium]
MPDKPTIVLDVDGTLVDTNYQHAIAWHRAFRAHGFPVAIWEIHRHIGMGGDQLVESLVGEEGEEKAGETLRDAHDKEYSQLIDEVEAMEGASELIAELDDAGATVILASSAQEEELDRYIELLGAGERIAGATSSTDAEQTKPHPELVQTALDKYGSGGPVLMIGDSTWDVKAAKRAGVPTLALLTGGFSEAELREAGAAEVKRSIQVLREEGVGAALDLAGTSAP